MNKKIIRHIILVIALLVISGYMIYDAMMEIENLNMQCKQLGFEGYDVEKRCYLSIDYNKLEGTGSYCYMPKYKNITADQWCEEFEVD